MRFTETIWHALGRLKRIEHIHTHGNIFMNISRDVLPYEGKYTGAEATQSRLKVKIMERRPLTFAKANTRDEI